MLRPHLLLAAGLLLATSGNCTQRLITAAISEAASTQQRGGPEWCGLGSYNCSCSTLPCSGLQQRRGRSHLRAMRVHREAGGHAEQGTGRAGQALALPVCWPSTAATRWAAGADRRAALPPALTPTSAPHLPQIASAFDMTVEQLLDWNRDIKKASLIYPKQVIKLQEGCESESGRAWVGVRACCILP